MEKRESKAIVPNSVSKTVILISNFFEAPCIFLIQYFSEDLEDEDDPFEKHKMKTALKDRCYLSEVYSKFKDKGKEELADKYAVRNYFNSNYST